MAMATIPGYRQGWQRRMLANLRNVLRDSRREPRMKITRKEKMAYIVGVREALNCLESAASPPAYTRHGDIAALQADIAHVNQHLRRVERKVLTTG